MVRNKPSSPTESEHMSMRPVRNVASLLAAANTILSDVDQSDFLEGNARREYPTITRDEIRIGDVLGIGGFSIVSEVAAIIPRDNTLKDNDVHEATAKQPWHKTEEEQALEDDIEPEHQHFEFDTAKKQLASRCLRSNKARYAIKRLDPMLSDIDRARGMIDMALEVKYLAVLWHPNIVKMRGISEGSRLTPDGFFVMDRLYGTLDRRTWEWRKVRRSYSGVFGFCADKQARRHLLVERLVVIHDLAVAFSYMHDNKLVYRDIKQENFGFDIRGDIKVFDFGLTKPLLPSLRLETSEMYRLTPITGSLPYMAPEVALGEPYNCSCDCFSFASLMYEILSLKNTPFHRFDFDEYVNRVAKGKLRPNIRRQKRPKGVCTLIKLSWEHKIHKRPSMKNIAKTVRTALKELSDEEEIINRSLHMRNRSDHSSTPEKGIDKEHADFL